MDPTLGAAILFLLTLILVAEQISYHRKKGNLPGPSFVFPFFGNALLLVRHPTHFWRRQSDLAAASPQGVSVNYILGRFILYIHTSHFSHFVFNNVRPDAFLLLGHPFGRKLFGDHNLIYMTGAHHRDLRRRISPNFSPRAFSTYTPIQYSILRRHLRHWSSLSGYRRPLRLRLLCRDLNLETSQTVFVGPYLDHLSRQRFSADYAIFNLGLMTLPIDLPGFAFRDAKLAVRRLVHTLSGCAKASRVCMIRGEEPRCLIDFWVQQQLKEEEENGGGGCSDEELGTYIFDFLFAAQDASTSALVWAVALMAAEPGVVEKVREEVRGLWRPESGEGMGAAEVRRLKYTETVAREVVRMRAPATMVPHVAGEEVRMGEKGWRIPKGSIVFPSVFDSSFQGFSEPERFDPERFGEERREEKRFRLNYLGFGAGSHQCVGERYAISHLVLFIAVFSAVFDWRREMTEGCDEIVYLPTISPKDDCFVHLYCRCCPELS